MTGLFFILLDHPLHAILLGGRYTVWLMVFIGIYAVLIVAYFIIGEWLQGGLTIGKRLTHIRLVDARTGGRPKLWQCAVRYSLLYFAFLPLPFAALFFLLYAFRDESVQWTWLVLCILLMLIYVTSFIWIVVSVLNRSSQLPHSVLSKTDNISTLAVPKMIAEDLEDGSDD